MKDLHLLMAQGKSETDEADVLRDAMEPHWHGLSEAERERGRWLSDDLYTIEGKGMLTKVPAEQRTREWLAPAFDAVKAAQDWDRMLDLLRTGPDYLAEDQIAYFRGMAYQNLKLPEIALLFFQYAEQKQPQNFMPSFAVLATLLRLGRARELLVKASQILAKKRLPTIHQFDVALVMSVATDQLPARDQTLVFRRVIQIIRRALENEDRTGRRDLIEYFGGHIYFVLGSCYWQLNENSAAISAFKECLKLNPSDASAAYILNKLTTSRETQGIAQTLREKIKEYASSLPAAA